MGEVVNKVSEATGHKAVVVTDVGQNQMFAARYSRYSEPRSVYDFGLRRVSLYIAGDTVVKSHAYGNQQVGFVRVYVRAYVAVHAEHAFVEAIR